MRRSAPIIVLAVCLSLLGLQLSGLHLHVGADGFDATPHIRHVHGAGAESADHELSSSSSHSRHVSDDHSGARDVSVADFSAGALKLVFLVWLGACLLLVVLAAQRTQPIPVLPLRETRRGRWRPPLRAPPSYSH